MLGMSGSEWVPDIYRGVLPYFRDSLINCHSLIYSEAEKTFVAVCGESPSGWRVSTLIFEDFPTWVRRRTDFSRVVRFSYEPFNEVVARMLFVASLHPLLRFTSSLDLAFDTLGVSALSGHDKSLILSELPDEWFDEPAMEEVLTCFEQVVKALR